MQWKWDLGISSGYINDVEFTPDNDYFVLATNIDFQVRKTESGELVKSFSFGANDIEFSPDGSRIILLSPFKDSIAYIQIRDSENFSLLNEKIITLGSDTTGYNYLQANIILKSLIVDPVRPYIYFIKSVSGYIPDAKYLSLSKIVIYDYEKMIEVKELASVSSSALEYFNYLAISKDAKYLASIGDGQTQLKIWDLETMVLKQSYEVCEATKNLDKWGHPWCIKFSDINSNNIYFSGVFQKWKDDDSHRGVFLYNMEAKNIIDSAFIIKNGVVEGYFNFLGNEERIVKTNHGLIKILNNSLKTIEFSTNVDDYNYAKRWSKKVIYSSGKDIIIGSSPQCVSSARYLYKNAVENFDHFESMVYPNPTNGQIFLENQEKDFKKICHLCY